LVDLNEEGTGIKKNPLSLFIKFHKEGGKYGEFSNFYAGTDLKQFKLNLPCEIDE
jgi:hypothetical protein